MPAERQEAGRDGRWLRPLGILYVVLLVVVYVASMVRPSSRFEDKGIERSRVVDERTGRAISGARVLVTSTLRWGLFVDYKDRADAIGRTHSTGSFAIRRPGLGWTSISIVAPGYATVVDHVSDTLFKMRPVDRAASEIFPVPGEEEVLARIEAAQEDR